MAVPCSSSPTRATARRTRAIGAGLALLLTACGDLLRATPEDRVGILRELIRARAVSGDTSRLDACSVDRFLIDLRTWRDSLLPAELARVVIDSSCAAGPRPRAGRFVITRWYQNPGGDYVVRGTDYPWDEVYRFSDGIFSRKERTEEDEFSAGIASPARVDSTLDSTLTPPARPDSATAADSTRSPVDSAAPKRSPRAKRQR